MSEITGERRLELLRAIREENERNRMNLRNQQNILYGNKYNDTIDTNHVDSTAMSTPKSISTVFIRFLIAIILFALFVIWDYSQIKIYNLDTTGVCNYIQDNYDFNIIDFIDKITYTNKDI